jgi:hypothetical protein
MILCSRRISRLSSVRLIGRHHRVGLAVWCLDGFKPRSTSGSTVGEKTNESAVSTDGRAAFRAAAVASAMALSTSTVI